MLHWGLGLAAVLIPVQLFFGHLTGLYVLQAPAGEVRRDRGALADAAAGLRGADRAGPIRRARRNLFAIEMPKLGSFIASGNWTAREIGLESFPREDRPPVVIPFFGFRIMVGMGLIMLGVSWLGNFLRWRGRLETTRWFLWGTFLSFPTGFIAILTGWYTAEVGRQPWVVYGLLAHPDAVTPSLTTGDVLFSLVGYVLVYAVLAALRHVLHLQAAARGADRRRARRSRTPPRNRPLAFADTAASATGSQLTDRSGDDDGTQHPRAVLGRGHCGRDPDLRDPRRFRSRRRHSVRHHARRAQARRR